MTKKRSFSLHLAKPGLEKFDAGLTANGRAFITSGAVTPVQSKTLGEGATLYVFPGRSRKPRWIADLEDAFSTKLNVTSRAPCAIVAFKAKDRVFYLTYSHAHVYMDFSQTEADFGLKVAVNFINDDQIRGVERAHLGLALRDFVQAASKRDFATFGEKDALDLIRKVSGHSDKNEFAEKVTGARALRFSKEMNFTEIAKSAEEALALFNSDAYKSTPFSVIDFLSEVRDPSVIVELNELLVKEIQGHTDEFEIGFPEFLSDDLSFFRFEGTGHSQFYPDLSLDLYVDCLGNKLTDLTVEHVRKRHRVSVYGEEGTYPIRTWSVHSSLVGSLLHKGKRYAINEGQWYCVDEVFKARADSDFSNSLVANDAKLETFIQLVKPHKGSKTKAGYEAEEDYNLRISAKSGYICMDQKFIKVPGKPGPGFELCDLLDLKGRRFIHVKKSSRSSSVLSHLFKQGTNSAQMFRQSEEFRKNAVAQVKKVAGNDAALEFQSALNKKWIVEFRIADQKRKNDEHNIPFFSKLSFRDERGRMSVMNYEVRLDFITLPRQKQKSSSAPLLSL